MAPDIRQTMFSRSFVALLALGAVTAQAAVVEIVHVWPSYRSASSFRRISEFVDGKESHGNETVLRSQPTSRDGYYFLLRTKSDAAVAGATITVEAILPGDPTPKPFAFTADLPAGKHVFHFGVTGTDWPGDKVAAVAWRITAKDSSGAVLATSMSFLWSTSAPR